MLSACAPALPRGRAYLACWHVGVVRTVSGWSPAAAGVEGSSLYLKAGERITVRELIYGLMLRSGNDAAVALAIATAGSMEAFVGRMNEKAQALGLTNTHFENPNGLDGEVHYSTARDLAKLSVCAMQNETFRAVVSSKSFT